MSTVWTDGVLSIERRGGCEEMNGYWRNTDDVKHVVY